MNNSNDFVAIKGFRDFTGEEARKREFVRKTIVEVYEKYGFEPAETPIVEDKNFVKGENENDEAISDIYSLTDKGKRELALRYEFTFQLKRLMQGKKIPYRRYSIGQVFRDEPVSSSRLRQITQADVDVVGATPRDEAEILAIAKEILEKLKIDFVIKINNRKLLNEILEKQKVSKKNFSQVIREIDKLEKIPRKELIERLKKFKAEKILDIFEKPISFFEKYKSFEEIKKLKKYCELYNVEIEFSPSLARGLSYYNGTVFEIVTKKIKESICGGGSYNFNGVQCTGLALGVDRLSMLTEVYEKKESVIIIPFDNEEKAIQLANFLREQNKVCWISSDKISKVMKQANSDGVRYIIFIGEDEIKKGKYKIRDMKSGEEKELLLDEIVWFLEREDT